MTVLIDPIVFNNATGSDTAASGSAASGVSLSGAGAVLNTSTTVTGIVTTSVVAGDLLWVDSSSGRQFSVIATVVSGTEVTVDDAFSVTESGRNWGIGGKRLSIAGSDALYSSSPDLKGGWTVQLASGFTETFSGQTDFFGVGTTSGGPVTWQGENGGTRPILTWTNNGPNLVLQNNGQRWKFMEFKNTNATKTISIGFNQNSNDLELDDMKLDDATNNFNIGILLESGGTVIIKNCSIRADDVGIQLGESGNNEKHTIRSCYIHNCGSHGIEFRLFNYISMQVVKGCLIVNNGGDGININQARNDGLTGFMIDGNTIDGNMGDGIEINNDGTTIGYAADVITNNILSNNIGFGIKFNTFTAIAIDTLLMMLDNNNTFNNSSGASSPSGILKNDPGLNPSYTNAGSGDYTIGVNLKAQGYPDNKIGEAAEGDSSGSSTRSFVDIGAAQREEPVGGGGSSAGRSYPRGVR